MKRLIDKLRSFVKLKQFHTYEQKKVQLAQLEVINSKRYLNMA